MAISGGCGEDCSFCKQRGLSRCFCGGLGSKSPAANAAATAAAAAKASEKEASLLAAGSPEVASLQEGLPLTSPQGGPSAAFSYKHTGAAQREEANSVHLPERMRLARAAAKAARDSRKEGERPLVDLWREASKPRKDYTRPSEAVPLQPPGCKLDSPDLFEQWLSARGLSDALERDKDQGGWLVYRYVKDPVVESQPDWEAAFHGTWWYAVWLILETGIFLESNDLSLGHDFWEPGVYCSPDIDTGLWYARPQIMFRDGVYHRVILELRVDPAQRKKSRKKGGVQWVFPMEGVALHAVWVRSNAPPAKGEERVNEWDPELEAVPLDSLRPEATVNTRQGPWPSHRDPHPFDLGSTDVPPWMRTGAQKASQATAKAKPKAAQPAWQSGPWSAWEAWEQAAWGAAGWGAAPSKSGLQEPAAQNAARPRRVGSDKFGTALGLYGRWLQEVPGALEEDEPPAKRQKNGSG